MFQRMQEWEQGAVLSSSKEKLSIQKISLNVSSSEGPITLLRLGLGVKFQGNIIVMCHFPIGFD